MLFRMLPLCLALVGFLALNTPAVAEDKDNTHSGKVVSVSEGKLTMTDKDGKEHSHTVAEDAKITCDGKECKLADLKAGTKIKVTTKKDDKKVATKIVASTKDA